jgi:GAF domain-containing protein
VAERIAKNMGVRTNEVAVMALSTRWKHLHFLAPAELKNVGYVPLSSNSALAARTARDGKAEIVNNFAAVRHASVFEGVKIGTESGEAIQKIISAPLLAEGRVVGILQISRKGPTAMSAGPDFTAEELARVVALCKPLGKLLGYLAAELET